MLCIIHIMLCIQFHWIYVFYGSDTLTARLNILYINYIIYWIMCFFYAYYWQPRIVVEISVHILSTQITGGNGFLFLSSIYLVVMLFTAVCTAASERLEMLALSYDHSSSTLVTKQFPPDLQWMNLLHVYWQFLIH